MEKLEDLHGYFAADDADGLEQALRQQPNLKRFINKPVGPFGTQPILNAKSQKMLDLLLEFGADINARSNWWAGGFGILDLAPPELAEYAIQRGALLDVHSAARLGKFAELRTFLDADPSLVRARGGDGQTPLHFAASVQIAELLLARGADIDARDLDHESTPAQYMVRSRQAVARYLIDRGCATDLFMAAALGLPELARRHLEEDPSCIDRRVCEEDFPMKSTRAGGSIYLWELGRYVSAVQVAAIFGHASLAEELLASCAPQEALLNACWLHRADVVQGLLGADPTLGRSLSDTRAKHLAHAARNNDTRAAELMLEGGFPVSAQGEHRATALHWAAFHGNADLVRSLLPFSPDIEDRRNEFGSSPLGWALHGSLNGWHKDSGNYPATVKLLLEAGADLPSKPVASDEVLGYLHREHKSL